MASPTSSDVVERLVLAYMVTLTTTTKLHAADAVLKQVYQHAKERGWRMKRGWLRAMCTMALEEIDAEPPWSTLKRAARMTRLMNLKVDQGCWYDCWDERYRDILGFTRQLAFSASWEIHERLSRIVKS